MKYFLVCFLMGFASLSCGSETEEAEVEVTQPTVEEVPLTMRLGVYQVTLEDGTKERWVHLPGGFMRFYYNGQPVLLPLNGRALTSDLNDLWLNTKLVANDIFTGALWEGEVEVSAVYHSALEGCYID